MLTFNQYLSEGAMNDHEVVMDHHAREGLKTVHATMRAAGYVHTISTISPNSAMEIHRYKKGNHSVSVNAWHGRGKYGAGKRILGVYDSNNATKKDPTGHVPKDDDVRAVIQPATAEVAEAHKAHVTKMIKHISNSVKV